MEIGNPDPLVWSLSAGSQGSWVSEAVMLPPRPLPAASLPRALLPSPFPWPALLLSQGSAQVPLFLDFPSLLGSLRNKALSPLLPTCAATVQSPRSRERTSL